MTTSLETSNNNDNNPNNNLFIFNNKYKQNINHFDDFMFLIY